MYLPLQQALAIRQWRDQNGTVSGVFSSVRAASMVTGALFAGALYEVAPRLPMWVCAAIFFATALVAFYNMLQYRRKDVYKRQTVHRKRTSPMGLAPVDITPI